MNNFKLGKVALTPQGTYDATKTYEKLDTVNYAGSSYIVLQEVTGITPVEGEYYTLLAEKGNTGARGATGRTGATGETGATGAMGEQGQSIYPITSPARPVPTESDNESSYECVTEYVMLPEGKVVRKGDTLICVTNGDIYTVLSIVESDAIPVEIVGNIKGATGETGATGATGKDGATAAEVIAALPKETWIFTLADGTTVEKEVPML